MLFLLKLLLITSDVTHGLIAYDCGSPNMNITTMSLLSIGECNLPNREPVVQSTYLQLLQLTEYSNVHVIQCKVEVDRTVYHCGMHSHVSLVANGRMNYIKEINYDTCSKLHITGSVAIGPKDFITGLRVKETATKAMTIAGTITRDGDCDGVNFADPYGSWDDVVVQATIRISLKEYYATTKPESDKILLKSGTQCALSDGRCMDSEDGQTFWASLPNDLCKFNSYDVLFEGKANKIFDNKTNNPEVYAITTQDVTFALAKKGEVSVCNYLISRTEHPRLFIFETKPGNTFTHKRPLAVSNLDLFTYVNSKFVYLEKHIKTQMSKLYRDVVVQQCQLEKQMLENALTLAKLIPEDFSHHIMKSPGYMAVVAGEAIHIIKCIPTPVRRRETKECYQQLPILRGNTSMYMAPKSRILLNTGTETDCNPYVPIMYQLDGIWYKISPGAVSTLPPQEIQPSTKNTWSYTNPDSLATSGIYSTDELNRLRNHIMFPAERPAVLNIIARSMTGQASGKQGISFLNLLDEATLERIAASTWSRMWNWFTGFGTISAGVLGTWVSIKVVKFILDTALHGYALHQIYGWSLHLVGAIWASLTNILLHRNKTTKEVKTEIRNPEDQGNRPTQILQTDEQVEQQPTTARMQRGNLQKEDHPPSLYPSLGSIGGKGESNVYIH